MLQIVSQAALSVREAATRVWQRPAGPREARRFALGVLVSLMVRKY